MDVGKDQDLKDNNHLEFYVSLICISNSSEYMPLFT